MGRTGLLIIAMKDIVWVHVTRVGSTKRFTCNYCTTELGSNTTHLKEHIVTRRCSAGTDIKMVMLQKLEEGRHERAASAAVKQRRDKRARDNLSGTMDGDQTEGLPTSQRTGGGAGQKRGCGDLDTLASTLSAANQERGAELCARWIYQDGLPFRVVESNPFKKFVRLLNPAFLQPCSDRMSNALLLSQYRKLKVIVDRIVELSCAAGDIVMGGDGFSDRKKSSIVSALVYTPDPMYNYTGL